MRFILSILLSFFVFSVQAEVPDGWDSYIENLQERIQEKGISQEVIEEGFKDISFLEHVVTKDQNQAEFKKTFKDYYESMVVEGRIQKGKEAWAEHKSLLKKISEKYGVAEKYLLAFWGLETNFGKTKGEKPLMSSLATLAFEGRRRTFFENQIEAIFRMMETGKIFSAEIKGSWAGAYGNFQFMPITAEAYAVDGDGDGNIDLVNSLPDAFESAANYLSKMGWKKGERWGREVVANQSFRWENYEEGEKKSLKEWNQLGIRCVNGSILPKVDMMAKLHVPQGSKGILFLTYSNFDKIMKWNHSVFYAIAVGRLADRIAGLPKLKGSFVIEKQISKDEIKEAQKKLKAENFYFGEIDGIIGKEMRHAIREYQKKNNFTPDGFLENSNLI